MVPSTNRLTLVALLALGCAVRPASPAASGASAPVNRNPAIAADDSIVVRREAVRISASVPLAATLLVPQVAIPAPAVVIVHGSGSSDRTNAWTSAYAEDLARSGVVVLHPDKRGSGESGGDWRTATFDDLASDAAAAVSLLRARPEVDSARVGALGFSQGGYVVPILASEHEELAFAAVISGGTLPLMSQVLGEIEMEAVERGAPLDSAERAGLRRIYERLFEFARSRTDWASLQAEAGQARTQSSRLDHALRTLPADSTHWVLDWIARTGDFDPLPYWRRVRQPVMMIYGGRDTQLRPRRSIERLWDAVGADAANFSVLLFQGNGHALHREDVIAMLAAWIADGGHP